jgi:hypothetical protein
MVYVVSLSPERPPGWDVSFLDIAQTHGKYMHPVGGSGWPKEPPNYIAFRFGGNQANEEARPLEYWNNYSCYELGAFLARRTGVLSMANGIASETLLS